MDRFGAEAVRYYSVGAFVVALDFCLFQAVVVAHVAAALAAAVTSPIAAAVHFSLNRTWGFKAFHGSIASQGAAYGCVFSFIWVASVAAVAYGTGVLNLAPLVAKCAAIIVTLPIGFFGHKYVTYGPGAELLHRQILRVAKGAGRGN